MIPHEPERPEPAATTRDAELAGAEAALERLAGASPDALPTRGARPAAGGLLAAFFAGAAAMAVIFFLALLL